MVTRKQVASSKRWVIKIGSAVLTNNGEGIDHVTISNIVSQIVSLVQDGKEIILVSSGAVAEGMQRLGWHTRPEDVHHQQAAAAVGQMGLIHTYEEHFSKHNIHTAQILLTHADLANSERQSNAKYTISTLLDMGVIPIINENDTVATEEIKFGDNDTLAALTANLITADILIILTDQDGMYDSDPRNNSDAKLLEECELSNPELNTMAGDGESMIGRGGMVTKLKAAKLAATTSASTIIASGYVANTIEQIANAESVGTLLC